MEVKGGHLEVTCGSISAHDEFEESCSGEEEGGSKERRRAGAGGGCRVNLAPLAGFWSPPPPGEDRLRFLPPFWLSLEVPPSPPPLSSFFLLFASLLAKTANGLLNDLARSLSAKVEVTYIKVKWRSSGGHVNLEWRSSGGHSEVTCVESISILTSAAMADSTGSCWRWMSSECRMRSSFCDDSYRFCCA